MLSPATHHSHSRRRFGLTEVLLIAGIVVFGAVTLLTDGGHTFGSLVAGFKDVTGS